MIEINIFQLSWKLKVSWSEFLQGFVEVFWLQKKGLGLGCFFLLVLLVVPLAFLLGRVLFS